jgi:transcriptional regulator with XRE-family HTH domain
MRLLRVAAGLSLRQAEVASGHGRGTLSQVENGKARPARELVEWYDTSLNGDGLLISLYAEARGARGPGASRVDPARVRPGDALRVEAPLLALGTLVRPGAHLTAGWTFVNTGRVAWFGRRLRRIGVPAAARMITSPPAGSLPDCGPGAAASITVPVDVPGQAGTFAAYWQVVDSEGCPCFGPAETITLLVVAR